MVSNNIPQVKLGIIAVSRDCFPIAATLWLYSSVTSVLRLLRL